MQILMCENEQPILRLVRVAAPPEWEIIEAETGDACVARLAAARPDLLLLDLQLPRPGGVEILQLKQADPALAAIPTIVISGRHEPEVREAALSAGADQFVTKPFRIFELLSQIEATVLRRFRAHELSADERRLVANELLYRRANEAIERALLDEFTADEPAGDLLTFMCECGEPCEAELRLTLAEYERVRSDPTWFAVAPGHENPTFEATVEQSPRFTLVQKVVREAIELSVEDDPRSTP